MPQFVKADGDINSNLLLVGEGPGKVEDDCGLPFQGPSGKELNRYLWQHLNRTRNSVRVTNLVRYRVPGDGDPTAADIKRDEQHLWADIRSMPNLEYIAAVGRHSARWFLGDVDMETSHGLPYRWQDKFTGRWHMVMPIYHPASGMHSPETQGHIFDDFEQLRLFMKGLIGFHSTEDPYPDPEYAEYKTSPASAAYRERNGNRVNNGKGEVKRSRLVLQGAAVDTEGSAERPWCLSYACEPGQATVIRTDQARKMNIKIEGRIILHNALHDLPVLEAMGIQVGDNEFDDTMIKAYLLCVEPQGLKQLAYRHCSMEMSSYEELIHEADQEHAVDFLVRAAAWAEKRLEAEARAKKEAKMAEREAKKAARAADRAAMKALKVRYKKAVAKVLQR